MSPQENVQSVAQEQLLAHFRAYAPQQPPAALDHAIMAAARRQAARAEPALSGWRRSLEVLRRPRWQALFASLLGVALMLGLVSHNVLDDPGRQASSELAFSDVPLRGEAAMPTVAGQAMRAPAPTEMLARPAHVAPDPSPRLVAQAAQQAAVQAGVAGAFVAQTKGNALPLKPVRLDDDLKAILVLREQGKAELAATRLAELQKRFPAENLAERLERLDAAVKNAKKQP